MNYSQIRRDLAFIALGGVLIVVGTAFSLETDDGLGYGGCEFSEKISFTFSDISYYPENETASVTINSTKNINSQSLENISIYTVGGRKDAKMRTKIKIDGNVSSSGLIATAESRRQYFLEKYFSEEQSTTSATDFPVEPVNITVLGGDRDDDGDGHVGIERGEQLGIAWYREENGCISQQDLPFLDIKEEKAEVNWKYYFVENESK